MILNPRSRRFFLFLLLVFLVLAQSPAQEKPMITVLPFSSIEVPAYISQIISQLFETHLVNTKGYDVLSQNEREQILAAQSESLEGCTDESCAIEIGRMLAAEQVILGTVAALGTKYIINAKIIDVTTSKTLGADMISAASVEDLDNACKTLTYSLVEKALPGLVEAGEEETEPSPEAVPEAEVAEEPAEDPEAEPLEEPEDKPKPERAPGQIDLVGYLTHTGGVVLQSGGNIAGLVGFGARVESAEAWDAYITAETGVSDLYRDYESYYEPYITSTIASYADWGAGAAVYAGSWLLTDAVSLSGIGRIAYAAGAVLALGGNFSALLSGNKLVDVKNAWNDYMAAETGVTDFYDSYVGEQGKYEATRYATLGCWALSGALLVASPFIPGEKYAAAPSFLNKLLFTVGSLFLSSGNIASSMALNARVTMEEAFDDYMAAAGGDNIYEPYLNAYYDYRGLTIITLGLWAAGGAATLTSLFVPFAGGADVAALPVQLSIQPAPTGFGAEFHITLE